MKLVLDSSIIIDYLRNGQVGKSFFEEKKVDMQFFLPTIVIFELFSGKSANNSRTVNIIEDFLHYFERITLTESIASRAGKLYREIPRKIDVSDYIIAASALEINGTVVTLNTKHFELIPNLNIYPL